MLTIPIVKVFHRFSLGFPTKMKNLNAGAAMRIKKSDEPEPKGSLLLKDTMQAYVVRFMLVYVAISSF